MTHAIVGEAPRTLTAPPATAGPMLVAARGEGDDPAIEMARLLAPRSRGGLAVVAVLAPLPMFLTGMEPVVVVPEYEAERKADLEQRVKREMADDGATGWPVEVLYGDPARVLTDRARERNAPLIVMGLGRHRPIDRVLASETALRTIRRADCPVLAVASPVATLPQTAVVATDFSPACASALATALPLLAVGATIHMVHVWQPCEREDERLEARDEAYRRSLPEQFRRFTASLPVPPGVTVKHETREGEAAERVLDFARAHRADLIVAGRQGHGLLERMWIGSVTTALLRGATCSVLVTPPPAGGGARTG